MTKKIAILGMTIILALSNSLVGFAGEWKSDNRGWWVQNEDGSYLTNQWYQSPESGLWYYLGEDGYMLTNCVTPDGYTVNENGVYVVTESISFEEWKADFHNKWKEAHQIAYDAGGSSITKFSFTTTFHNELTEEMVNSLCNECAVQYDTRRFWRYKYHASPANNVLEITAANSDEWMTEDFEHVIPTQMPY